MHMHARVLNQSVLLLFFWEQMWSRHICIVMGCTICIVGIMNSNACVLLNIQHQMVYAIYIVI